jgi:hypothetical protein
MGDWRRLAWFLAVPRNRRDVGGIGTEKASYAEKWALMSEVID